MAYHYIGNSRKIDDATRHGTRLPITSTSTRHSTRPSLVTVVNAQTRNTVKVHVAVSILLLFVPTLHERPFVVVRQALCSFHDTWNGSTLNHST